MKRLVGVIAWFLMLHLTVAGSDLVCATHASGDGQHEHGAHTAEVSHVHLPAHTESAPAKSCPTPVNPNCCTALASCIASFAAADHASGIGRPALTGDLPRERATYLPLPVTAPETPPPRA